MRVGILLAVGLPLVTGAILPRSFDFELKDALASSPTGWTLHSAAPLDHPIHLRIALKQGGIEKIQAHLEKSSDPFHPQYGLHLSPSEVAQMSAPSQSTIDSVLGWLADHGIPDSKCRFSPSRDSLSVSLPVGKVQAMLNTTYGVYVSESTGAAIVRTERYSLPTFLSEHVELVAPTTYFSRMHAKRKGRLFRPVGIASDAASGGISSVCNSTLVTSECLRTFYGSIDYVPQAAEKNLIGVTGYLGEAALRADLQMFLKDQRPDAVGHTFAVDLVNNGTNPQKLNETQIEEGVGQEANLDVQTVFGVTFPTPVTFFSTGGSPPFIPDEFTPTDTNEPYLEWVEFMFTQKKLPSVVTTSYDDDEQTVPRDLAIRVCNDFMRLGAMGVSVLFASGDDGVGPNGVCLSNNGTNAPTFLPEFPSTCPFVTSVGATMNFTPEVAVADVEFDFFSGAGFSNFFERPSYQHAAVGAYLAEVGDIHPGLFNRNGRAVPDVAAQGSNFKIAWEGKFGAESGTSASTPLFSSMIALLNDARLAKNLTTLGFLNPWLYSVGHAGLNDITIGSSAGCNTTGFPATKGWDAVTGLGTPNFPKLKELAIAK